VIDGPPSMEKPSENFLVFILIGDDKYKFFLVYLTDGKYFLIIFRNKVVSGCTNYIFLLVYSFCKRNFCFEDENNAFSGERNHS
jgi:hypothetical protein